MPTVAVCHAAPEVYLPLLRESIPEARLRVCRTPEEIATGARDAEVALAFKFAGRPFPRHTLLDLPALRWLQLASAGPDHVLPFDPARLAVTSASGLHGDTMAEYVLATLVHMRWDFDRLRAQQTAGQWVCYDVPTLQGLTLGVVGAGHVGGRIARLLRAVGMRTLGVRRTPAGDPGEAFDEIAGLDRLGDVLARADVVVIAVPLTAETRGRIDAAAIARIKRGAWFVNVSRGGVVDEAALLAALRRGDLAGAILDVFAEEPLPAGHPFWRQPRVFVTPHISSEFAGWHTAVARLFLANLERYRRGEPLRNLIDPVRGY